jgi:hypothetical protein
VIAAAIAIAIVVLAVSIGGLIGGAGVVMVPSARIGNDSAAIVGGAGADAQSSQCPREETAEHPTPRAARRHDSRKLIEAFPFHDPSPQHDA